MIKAALTVVFIAALCSPAAGQAWPAPEGVGAVSLTYQVIENTGHTLTDGSLIPDGKSRNMSVFVEGDYAVTDRLSITAGLPYVMAKYLGPNPPPPPVPYLPNERCGCWNHGVQDFSLLARYSLVNTALGLMPSVSLGVPSHGYDFRGEAALGSHLREIRMAMDAGVRLDQVSPNLSVQGRYSYAIVEKAADVSHNRSNASVEAAYLFARKLSVRGFAAWQHTHGGLQFGSLPPADLVFPGEVNTPERLFQHDRLLKDNNWRLGAGAAYSLPSVDLFVSYISYVKGTDSHAGHVVSFGVSVPFEISHP
ncbi:MAG: hypothetical protein ABI665_15030 [Vicinamibacterales bacterium]